MATNKNITMRQFNGTDYDTLYPKTKVEQVEGAYTQQQILADSTKTLFGLGTDAVPDDMWANLVPVGGILWYAKDGIPNGYLKCDGSVISRKDYNRLFNVIGTAFGAGDGSTTFSLPDMRAAFVRGAGSQNGYNATFGVKQEATGILVNSFSGGTNLSANPPQNDDAKKLYKSYSGSNPHLSNQSGNINSADYEYKTRPYNIALTPIIKY